MPEILPQPVLRCALCVAVAVCFPQVRGRVRPVAFLGLDLSAAAAAVDNQAQASLAPALPIAPPPPGVREIANSRVIY